MAIKNIGKIVNTFGIKGQLKISISTSTPETRFAVGKKILIDDETGIEKEYVISSFRMKGDRIAIIGLEGYDDINDIEVLDNVGYPFSVPNAESSVKTHAVYISSRSGGNGAIRDIAEKIIEINGQVKL